MNREELEQVYDEHADSVFYLFLSFARNESDARDLLQDWLIKTAAQEYPEAVKNQRAWFLKTAYRMAVDWARKNDSRRRTDRSFPIREFAPEIDPDREEIRISVEAALHRMPEEQAAILRLKLWDGLSFREISEVLDLPANTVASRYRYGIGKLRENLEPLYRELCES